MYIDGYKGIQGKSSFWGKKWGGAGWRKEASSALFLFNSCREMSEASVMKYYSLRLHDRSMTHHSELSYMVSIVMFSLLNNYI